MTYQTRDLTVAFRLADGSSFDAQGDDTYTAPGLRVSAKISRVGTGGMDTGLITTWGLPPSVMNPLSTLGKPLLSGRNNTITLSAGANGGSTSVVYVGIIAQAYVDGANQPSVGFVVQGSTALLAATQTIPPSTFPGSVDVATVISGLANQAGAAFQNFGVQSQINSPYLWGSALDQAKQIAEASHAVLIIDQNTWIIWPQNGGRAPDQIPLISPDTGLVGYPAYTDSGIVLTTLFNPQIAFGGYIKVQSSIPNACGVWQVFNATHELESQTPGGKWFTTLECSKLGTEGRNE